MNEEQKLAEQALRDAGISQPDSTPMGIIEMEGRFFQGISQPHVSSLSRVVSVIAGMMFVIVGALMIAPFVYALLSGRQSIQSVLSDAGIYNSFVIIFYALLGGLLVGGGLTAISRNFKKKPPSPTLPTETF